MLTPALKGRKLDWSCEPPSGKIATHFFWAKVFHTEANI